MNHELLLCIKHNRMKIGKVNGKIPNWPITILLSGPCVSGV